MDGLRRRRNKIFLAVLVSGLLIFSAGLFLNRQKVEVGPLPDSSSDSPLAPRVEENKIVRVVDGDTIAIDVSEKTKTVRLIGIDAPEIVGKSRSAECLGKMASDRAKEVLAGKSVKLEADESQGERDKYGRLLRYVFLEDGTNFNEMMVEEGFAKEYTYNLPYKYQNEFKQAEKEAQEAKRGLWSPDACDSGQ